MSSLSSDILHQVFKFFVSENQIVDGESLRIASLVCKQWRDVADSKTLWSSSIGKCSRTNDENDRYCLSSTVHRSLQIKERNGDAFENEIALQASLMGFKNLKCYRALSRKHELYFHIIERATGTKLLLSMSCEEIRNPFLIRELYTSHFQSKEDFLLREPKETNQMHSPLGISVWKGRVIRWYRSESEIEAIDTINRISSRLMSGSCQDIENNMVFLRQIMHLEKISLREKNDVMHYAQSRQHMVDWVSDGSEKIILRHESLFESNPRSFISDGGDC